MTGDIIQVPDALKNDYLFLRLLGEGSCGRTWLAKELRSGSEVAIKELKFYNNFKQLDLFKRESETLKTIDVRGIPKYYKNVDATSLNGANYLIQEYIPYPSLQSLLDSGRIFSEREVLDILYGIGKILYELQNRYSPPVLHRDIKPSNILYNDMQRDIEVYLIDFGSVANPQKQSEFSTVAGTYGYMAPEQLMGESRIQSDYYALGATAVHLLCGVSPYDIPHEVFKMQFEGVFEAKRIRISTHFLVLLQSMLAPDISKRPMDAAVLLTAIRNVMDGKPPFDVPVPVKTSSLWHKIQNFFADPYKDVIDKNHLATTTGYIQSIRWYANQYLFEYTFEVSSESYVGFAIVKSKKYKIFPDTQIRFSQNNATSLAIPDQCEVTCSTVTPEHVNYLSAQTIYLSDRLYQQYKSLVEEKTDDVRANDEKQTLEQSLGHRDLL